MQTHKAKWQVSLSNGETFFEGKGSFKEIEGELSPWQRLIRYTADKKIEITSLSLYTDDGRTFNLPSLGKNPKFRPFLEVDKPIDYNLARYVARDISGIKEGNEGKVTSVKVSDWFTVAEAVYSTYKLQLWVDENNPKNCWVSVVPT